MRITEGEVLHVAALAELDVPPADVAPLTEQLDAIVSYVAQLERLGLDPTAAPLPVGPVKTPFRPDEVRPVPLAVPPAAFAPDFRDGFFVVPRLEAMEGE